MSRRAGGRLRRSRHVSFFRKQDEIYLYHDLWGYILAMDRNVHEFIEAFGDGAAPAEVQRRFKGLLAPEQMDGFVDALRLHRTLVPVRLDEEDDAFRTGYPTRAAWTVAWSDAPEHVVLAYRDRALDRVVLEPLDELGARFFGLCGGDRTLADVAQALAPSFPGRDVAAAVRRLVLRLTHSDRQVLKLTDRPLYEYLSFPPPYLRSTMPYPRLDEPAAERGDIVDLASYHREEIGDAGEQFDVEETTLSHMFREPHPALEGRSYGEAFCCTLLERGLMPSSGNVVEVGGGIGFFAYRFLAALEQRAPERYAALRYTILDLSPVLQQSQRMLNTDLEGKVRYLLGNASRPLPLRDGSVDLLVSNEVIADLETVRLRRSELACADGNGRVVAARALAQRHGLALDDAPEVFWLNLGALHLTEELARVLAPGGAAVLTEFGGRDSYPVESTHLDHGEFSIHFGHVEQVARSVGLEVESTDIMTFLGMNGGVRVLATTRTYFECLRALLERRGVSLQKLAYTEEQLRELCGARLDPAQLSELGFRPVRDRALGLHPPEFQVVILRKPEPTRRRAV